MTTQRFVLPYMRPSLHVPKRDLVLTGADSLNLKVSVVEDDHPAAPALELTGGIGGPAMQLRIWPDGAGWRSWDYGYPWSNREWLLGAFDGTIDPTARGTFDFFLPVGTMCGLPRRSAWAMLLSFDGGRQATLLAEGHLHVRWSEPRSFPANILLTDNLPPSVVPTGYITLEDSSGWWTWDNGEPIEWAGSSSVPAGGGITLEAGSGGWEWDDGTPIEWGGSAPAGGPMGLEAGSGDWSFEDDTAIEWG